MIIIRVSNQTNSCWCQKSTSVILEIFFEEITIALRFISAQRVFYN